jgi:hypothetical protein
VDEDERGVRDHVQVGNVVIARDGANDVERVDRRFELVVAIGRDFLVLEVAVHAATELVMTATKRLSASPGRGMRTSYEGSI